MTSSNSVSGNVESERRRATGLPFHKASMVYAAEKSTTGYIPIENYGLIGNMRTCALVGIDGSLDFMCWYVPITFLTTQFLSSTATLRTAEVRGL